MSKMVLVAGEELYNELEAEKKAKIPHNGSGFKSEELCKLQQLRSKRGILGAEIVESFYGYSVRYDSGLQDFGLLASSKSRQLDGSFECAAKWASNWVSQDPSRRYAWTRNEELV